MSDLTDLSQDGVEQLSLQEFTEKAYLEYSMYVILDRALPHIGDGLKPVQRRIVYAMSELGLKASSKYKKSARTVGDVLGKYHPHGDSACYEAMVLMAQPFSYRHPLVDGQGNWGSTDDPKSFAAMRYTESRLTAYSEVLLGELGQGTVDWVPNFDGTMEEPSVLPARLPNLLLNGTTGIAVGMATDIPPHNLKEIARACIHLMDFPEASVEELFEIIQGPDFPTEAELITPKEELIKIYSKGNGSLKMRAAYQLEDGDVVITALPHQVSGAKILEQIASQMQAKKLPMVTDLRDESDHENPIRLVIQPKNSRVDTDAVMAHLFATTDLEKSYRVNMNVIGLNGKPQVKNLPTMLKEWLTFRKETVRRRLQFRLDKVLKRLHLLEGFMTAFLNIDEVINIIRNEDFPKATLIKRFGFSDIQAEAILDLKLRSLAKLEENKIVAEQNNLEKERKGLEKNLGSDRHLQNLIRKELTADMAKFGNDRKSQIVERAEAKALTEADLAPAESITIVVSAKGWIRSAKGHDLDPVKLNYKSGDKFKLCAKGKSNQQAVFFDSTGRSYSLAAHSFPSARTQGEPLTGRLNPVAGANFEEVLLGQPDQKVLLSSDAGYGFICKLSDLYTKNKAGKAAITLPENSIQVKPLFVEKIENTELVAITNEGRILIFPLSEMPVLAKGKGNQIISIPAKRSKDREEFIIQLALLQEGQQLVLHSGKRHFLVNSSYLEEYRAARGRRGTKLPRGYQKVDRVEIIEGKNAVQVDAPLGF